MGAGEALPAAPARYFNDFARVTSPATQEQLNRELEQFERDQSCQIVVAIFPKLPEGAALEDFTVRTATSWKAGRKGLDNGVILFLFISNRAIRIEVGYGLEGKIPDAIAKRITSERIRPSLQRGDYDAGLTAGVHGLMEAARGEYKGTGQTVAGAGRKKGGSSALVFFVFALFMIVFLAFRRSSRGSVYGRRGYSTWGGLPGGWSGGSGSWGGGGVSSGGGFSGGGGSFGGGGASDSW